MFLVSVLFRHEFKEITTHIIVIQVGFVFVIPIVDELIRQRVN